MKKSVAEALMKLFDSGYMTADDVDERAVEMMNSFPEDQARYIVEQLRVCPSEVVGSAPLDQRLFFPGIKTVWSAEQGTVPDVAHA